MAVLGSELVANGGFDTDTDWTLSGAGVTWNVGGYLVIVNGGNATQSLSVTASRTYRVTFDIEEWLGAGDPCWVAVGRAVNYSGGERVVFAANGSYSADIVCGSDSDNVTIVGTLGPSFVVDNVSVIEISTATTIEAALYDILRLNATVSGQASSRVYPQIIPQDTSFPAIRYNQISGVRGHTLGGTDDMVPARFQVDCYGSSYANARVVADAVRGALDNFSDTAGSVVIQCAHLIDEGDYFDETVGVDQLRRYGKTQDYMIWYNE